jgi:hypothetical protein
VGTITGGPDLLRGDSAVQTGLSSFNESLLSYIIFAATWKPGPNQERRDPRRSLQLNEGAVGLHGTVLLP